MSHYTDPVVVDTPDVYRACFELIMTYALPQMEPDNIFRGWGNRETLPPSSNDYAVMSLITSNRRGTNVTKFSADPEAKTGTFSNSEMVTVEIQLDFCSDDDARALGRAMCIQNVARSQLGTYFFRPYGISCLYASGVTSAPVKDSSVQFVKRYMTTLSLSYWHTVNVTSPSYDRVDGGFTKVGQTEQDYAKNVDVYLNKK